MRIDIHELEEFNRLASNGAEQAARALGQLTGMEIYVEGTGVNLVTAETLEETFAGRQHIGVRVGLSEALSGEATLVFEPEDAKTLLESMSSPADSGVEFPGSTFAELGNIMIGGFITGWANYLGRTIEMTPPTYLEATGMRVLPRFTREAAAEQGVFIFESQLTATGSDLSVPLYLIPEYREFVTLLAARSDSIAVPVDRLPVFNDLAAHGAERVAEQITTMTGRETDLKISQLRFFMLRDVPDQIEELVYAGAVFELTGHPSGYFVILFEESTAESVASSMLPDGVEASDSMREESITELGNIITSGFIDGWADTLGTSIEHSPPRYVHDFGPSILSSVVGQLSRSQEGAFVIDATIQFGNDASECQLFMLPDRSELVEIISELPSRLE